MQFEGKTLKEAIRKAARQTGGDSDRRARCENLSGVIPKTQARLDSVERRLEELRRALEQIDQRGWGQTLTLLSDITGLRRLARRGRISWVIIRNAFRRRLFSMETARAIQDMFDIYGDIRDTITNIGDLNQTGQEWSKIQTQIFNAGQDATAAYRAISELKTAFERNQCADFSRPPAEGFVGVSHGKSGGSKSPRKPTSFGKTRSGHGGRKK